MDSFNVKVIHILSEPILKKRKWCIKVGFYCFGKYFTQELNFNSEKEVKKVKIGYEFKF